MSYMVEALKFAHCFPQFIRKYMDGNGVDLGSGHAKVIPRALGIDFGHNYYAWEGDVTNLNWFKDGVLDYVFSSHCLEHVEDDVGVLVEWKRVLKPGGYLLLYLPDDAKFDNTAQVANGEHKHVYRVDDVKKVMVSAGFELVECFQHYGPIVVSGVNSAAYSIVGIARKPKG